MKVVFAALRFMLWEFVVNISINGFNAYSILEKYSICRTPIKIFKA